MNGRKYFSREARENIPPAARGGDAVWTRANQHESYLRRGGNSEVLVGGRNCCGGGPVEDQRALKRYVRLYPSSVVLTAKIENRNSNFEQGFKG